MLLESKSSSQTIQNYEPSIQTPENNKSVLINVSEAIAQATIKWMTLIAQSAHDAKTNYSKDHTYLQKNMWYADDLLKACVESKQPKMVEFIKKNHKQHLGFVPPEYFNKMLKPKNEIFQIKFRSYEFLAKPNVLPSDALKAAITGLSIIDCGVACQIALYGALHDVLGERKFNILFSQESGQLMNIGFCFDDLQPLKYFITPSEACVKELKGKPGDRPVKAGQLVGFEGAKYYQKKYPFSDWANLNTICSCDIPGQQKFVAFGTDPAGNSEEEINKLLFDNYKEDRDPFLFAAEDIESVRLTKLHYEAAIADKKQNVKQAFDSVQKAEGFRATSTQEFIVELIEDLVKLPLEDVSMNFVKNHWVNKNRFKHIHQNSSKK